MHVVTDGVEVPDVSCHVWHEECMFCESEREKTKAAHSQKRVRDKRRGSKHVRKEWCGREHVRPMTHAETCQRQMMWQRTRQTNVKTNDVAQNMSEPSSNQNGWKEEHGACHTSAECMQGACNCAHPIRMQRNSEDVNIRCWCQQVDVPAYTAVLVMSEDPVQNLPCSTRWCQQRRCHHEKWSGNKSRN